MKSERAREILTYAIVAAALAAVAFFTLRRDGYIAAGDIYPAYFMPGNHVLEKTTRMWGEAFSGLGSPQWASGATVFALWGMLWLSLGVPGPTVQFTLNAAVLVFVGLSTAFFARTLFPERRLIAVVAGLSLPLSFYAAQVMIDAKLMFAVGFFPFSAAFLVRRLREPVPWYLIACEIGLLSPAFMILATTPPIAVYELLWAACWTVGAWLRWRTFRTTWAGIAGGALAATGINAWWWFAAYTTLFASGGASVQTFQNPVSWQWVDQNASILRMLSMQGMWTFPRLIYFPYAAVYLSGWRHWALYAPLAFAIVGIALAPYRRRVWLLVAIAAVSLFIGKGFHQPFGVINALLYEKLPFYWLFRDPQVETNITLYLSLFTLAALGVCELYVRARAMLARRFADVRSADAAALGWFAILMVLLLSNGAIFFSGDLFPQRWLGGLARLVVTPPSYWKQTAQFFNALPHDDTRVLLLPNDDFYQMPYDWGYYGIDTVAQTFIERPVVLVSPESFNYLGASAAVRAQYATLLREIARRSKAPIAPLMSSLDVGWIVQRNDVDWTHPLRSILPPAKIARYLANQRQLRKVASFDKLDVYRVPVTHGYLSAYDALGVWASHGAIDSLSAFRLVGRETPWVAADTPGIPPSLVSARISPTSKGRALRAAVRRSGLASAQPVTSSAVSWWRYDARLSPATRVVVLHASYSPGWHVEADGERLDWPHVAVDGYLNGWIAPVAAPANVSIVYEPARLYLDLTRLAMIVFILCIAGYVTALVVAQRR
ncbi:MAG: hypothetical protein JO194_10515 [Candidatus Eremiobacteraeota bacterium]|nr:hypothetical protein [Candidatus Eremiobacteraeota bacterium]